MSSSPSSRRATIGPLVVVGVVGLLVVAGVAAAVSVIGAVAHLRDARTELVAAESALRDAELAEARTHLATGVDHAEAASRSLHRPWVWPVRWIPFVGPNLRTVTALGDAVHQGGAAASDLLTVADTIVRDDRDQEHGEISLAYLEELRQPLRRLADALREGVTDVEAIPDERLLGQVASQRRTFLRIVEPATEQAEIGAQLTEVLPPFLGADEPRRYLVGAMSLSELRATGGLLGSFSVLVTDRGRLEFDEFAPIDDLPNLTEDVQGASLAFERRYGPQGAQRIWRNVNLSPDFPDVARTALAMWEATGREPLDGVLLIDPIAFSNVLQRVGPVELQDGLTLDPDDALEFLTLTAYAEFDDDDVRKRVLGAAAAASVTAMFDALDDGDVPATAAMLAELAAGSHVRIYTHDAAVQELFDEVGLGQVLPEEAGAFSAITVNNVAGNKVDVFTDRVIDQDIRLLPGGEVETTTTVTFVNHAPREGYPRHVLGPWAEGAEAGDNVSEVSFLCGLGCEVVDRPDGARAGGFVADLAADDVRVHLPAGAKQQLSWTDVTPDAWWQDGDDLHLTLRHWVQPTVRPTQLRIRVVLPDNTEVRVAPDDVTVGPGAASWSFEGSGPVTLPLVLERS